MPRIGLELDSFVLIAAKQDDFFAAGFDEEADVAFPAQKAFARNDRDAAKDRYVDGLTPRQP